MKTTVIFCTLCLLVGGIVGVISDYKDGGSEGTFQDTSGLSGVTQTYDNYAKSIQATESGDDNADGGVAVFAGPGTFISDNSDITIFNKASSNQAWSEKGNAVSGVQNVQYGISDSTVTLDQKAYSN